MTPKDPDEIAPIRRRAHPNDRDFRFSHRRARRLDRSLLASLAATATRIPDPTAADARAAGKPDSSFDAGLTRIVEVDDRIAGWLAARSRGLPVDLPLEPWGRIDSLSSHTAGSEIDERRDRALHIVEFAWQPLNRSDSPGSHRLRESLTIDIPIEWCQLLGFNQITARLAPRSWSTHAEELSREAYVQQLHSGPVTSPVVTPMLENGWRLDGWLSVDQTDAPLLLLRWLNPVMQ